MECRMCKREKIIHKSFKNGAREKICDDCLEMFGISPKETRKQIEDMVEDAVGRRVDLAVQRELPGVIESVLSNMIRDGGELEFELVVK